MRRALDICLICLAVLFLGPLLLLVAAAVWLEIRRPDPVLPGSDRQRRQTLLHVQVQKISCRRGDRGLPSDA